MVDAKLFAGVTQGFRIKHEITNELLQERNEHKTYFQLRNFNMVIALTAQHIRNRMKQLCLDPDMLAQERCHSYCGSIGNMGTRTR
jgi:hypothetical protein